VTDETIMTTDLRNALAPGDMQVVQALIDENYPYDCDVFPVDESTWAIHGPIPVDGEVILAEFASKEDAQVALGLLAAAQRRTRDA
jgi:hypothetical protein